MSSSWNIFRLQLKRNFSLTDDTGIDLWMLSQIVGLTSASMLTSLAASTKTAQMSMIRAMGCFMSLMALVVTKEQGNLGKLNVEDTSVQDQHRQTEIQLGICDS